MDIDDSIRFEKELEPVTKEFLQKANKITTKYGLNLDEDDIDCLAHHIIRMLEEYTDF